MKYEKSKLYSILGKPLVSLFKQCNAIVAGGTITSLFCNRDIADIDVYVRSEKDLVTAINGLYKGNHVMCHTKKATLFNYGGLAVQVIHIGYFEASQNVFENFDFTVCMGAFDFSTENFVLHPDFLKHNSQRVLEFNGSTKFPMMSALRVQKYKEKGYEISKAEFMKIILACMDLHIENYAELKEHLGGMYGLNMDKVFDETKPFSLVSAMEQLSHLYVNEDYYKEPTKVDFESADDIIENIIGDNKKFFVSNGKKYLVRSSGKAVRSCDIPEDATQITPREYFADHKMFKYVKEVNGKFLSHYDKSFEYILGEVAVAQGSNGRLFCGFNKDSLMYDGTLIELELVDEDDIVDIDRNVVELKKAKFTRIIEENDNE